jgi:outer membrane protein assembly factor BamB
MIIHCLLILNVSLAAGVAAASQPLPWPDRNGPTFDGRAADEDGKDVPIEWDEATGRNVAWKIPVEGRGHSTPVIGLGRIWLTAATEDGTRQYVVCVDAETGEVLHRRLLFENADPEPLGNTFNTYASPTCVLEADAVYVHFGTYGTARLDPATAETVWQRRDIHCRHFRGPGSSPVLFGDLLILTFDGIDQQFLTALDKRTGETVWRTDRSTDFKDLDMDGNPRLEGDYRKAYGTPGLAEVDGRTQVVSVGARAAFGYDALTGRRSGRSSTKTTMPPSGRCSCLRW